MGPVGKLGFPPKPPIVKNSKTQTNRKIIKNARSYQLSWPYGRSEGFPLAAYFIPGREGRVPGQNPELFLRRRRRRCPARHVITS